MKTISTFLLLACTSACANAQQNVPVIKSNISTISIRDGSNMKVSAWTLAPEAKPDVYEADLIDGNPHRVTFITDVDTIGFWVELGKKYDFIIRKGDDVNYTQIVGRRFTPSARFDADYIAKHRGGTFIEVPEVYELINVAIALTPIAIADRGLVHKNNPYYTAVRAHFDKHAGHPVVAMLDSAIRRNRNSYFTIKMNGYAFEYDNAGRIVKSRVYERTGFNSERSNTLAPYIAQLQAFGDVTGFREFYRTHNDTYQRQIAFYRDTANIAEMKAWLERNFPGRVPYQAYKVIFSPLVAYNQSVTWFASNGFTELQPHINFPYPQDLRFTDPPLSDEATKLFRGNIAFTEINHGYINPEADKYRELIAKAISNRNFWVDSAMGPGYYGGNSAFTEYMNWALVSLRIADYSTGQEQVRMLADVDRLMLGRSFPRFPELTKFLVPLYRNRARGQTLADLYPQIIVWFDEQNARSLR